MRLATENLSVRLSGRPVLAGVSIAAEPGAVTGLIGPNGAGKSTVLRVLAGLIEPDGGSVSLDDRDWAAVPRAERARRIAYLPQGRTAAWAVSVETLVGLGRLPYRGFGAVMTPADQAAVERALGQMDIAHLRTRAVTELSGGELARTLTARALAQEPEVLLADEPTAGLDPAHELALFAHLRTMALAGCCVVMALHDLTAAARFCHTLVLLKDGAVLSHGPAADVLTPEAIRAAYGIVVRSERIGGEPVILPVALAG